MQETNMERMPVVFFRLMMGWTFLYAGLSQLANLNFSVAGFILHAKTAHNVLFWFGQPTIAPYVSFLVEWGHTLIGLSLLTGFLVRFSSPFGILLLAMYYFGHMDWPYVENRSNFIVDYHIVYIGVLLYLMQKRAGYIWGLDGLLENGRVLKAGRGREPA